jgi:hypothetical protein
MKKREQIVAADVLPSDCSTANEDGELFDGSSRQGVPARG